MVATNNDTIPNTMKLWREVCKTDPAHTKKVSMRGGFTAIDPQYQLQVATELWGPYGAAWGIRHCNWSMIELAAFPKPTMVLDAEFFYPGGEFEISSDMPFQPNDDCRKKLLTAVRSKALSLLGFNADVFMGQYDDEKYVAEMKTMFTDESELRAKILKTIRIAKNADALAKCRERIEKLRGDGAINKAMYDEGLEAIEQQQREI